MYCPRVPVSDQRINDYVTGRPYLLNPVENKDGIVRVNRRSSVRLAYRVPGSFSAYVLWHLLSVYTLTEDQGVIDVAALNADPDNPVNGSDLDLRFELEHAGDRDALTERDLHWTQLVGTAAYPSFWRQPTYMQRGSIINVRIFNNSPTVDVGVALQFHTLLTPAGPTADRQRAAIQTAYPHLFDQELARWMAPTTYDLSEQLRRAGVARWMAVREGDDQDAAGPFTLAAGSFGAPTPLGRIRALSTPGYGGAMLYGFYATVRPTAQQFIDRQQGVNTSPVFVRVTNPVEASQFLTDGFVPLSHIATALNYRPGILASPYSIGEDETLEWEFRNLGEEVRVSVCGMGVLRRRDEIVT